MDDAPTRLPAALPALRAAAREAGFTRSCDGRTGNLLAVLAAFRPGGRMLELGTGVGEGTAWLLSGMSGTATLVTVELDPATQAIGRRELGDDPRVRFVIADGGAWLKDYSGDAFDLIFADTRPGKFTHLDRALELVAPGGAYLIDDLLPGPDWARGHHASVRELLAELDRRDDFHRVRLAWASGLLLAVRSG